MICMANTCKQGKKLCPTPLTCSGFDPAAEAPIIFASPAPEPEPEPATWAWVDGIAEQARDVMLALMGVAGALVVGSVIGYGFYLMVRT